MDDKQKALILVAGLAGVFFLTKPVAASGSYTCSVCGEEFTTFTDLESHVLSLWQTEGDPHYGMRLPIQIKWS